MTGGPRQKALCHIAFPTCVSFCKRGCNVCMSPRPEPADRTRCETPYFKGFSRGPRITDRKARGDCFSPLPLCPLRSNAVALVVLAAAASGAAAHRRVQG